MNEYHKQLLQVITHPSVGSISVLVLTPWYPAAQELVERGILEFKGMSGMKATYMLKGEE